MAGQQRSKLREVQRVVHALITVWTRYVEIKPEGLDYAGEIYGWWSGGEEAFDALHDRLNELADFLETALEKSGREPLRLTGTNPIDAKVQSILSESDGAG